MKPLSSSITFFETKSFLKNSGTPLRKFSALRDKKLSTGNRDEPLLIHKFFFDTRNFPENRVVPLHSFLFWSRETKNFDKTVMPPPLPWMKIFDKRIFLNHQSVLQWMFRYSMTKTSRPTLIPPPLLSIKYFSLPAVFWSTEGFSGEVFSVLWEKQNFDKTVKPPVSSAWNSSIPEFFRNTEVYRHWDTKKTRQKILILPPSPPLTHKFLRYGKSCETKKGSQEVFRYCETTTFV